MAEGSLWAVVADRPDRSGRDDGRARPSQGPTGIRCDDEDGQNRYRCAQEGRVGRRGRASADSLSELVSLTAALLPPRLLGAEGAITGWYASWRSYRAPA